jgi:hypothetical protein
VQLERTQEGEESSKWTAVCTARCKTAFDEAQR